MTPREEGWEGDAHRRLGEEEDQEERYTDLFSRAVGWPGSAAMCCGGMSSASQKSVKQ